MSKPFIAALLVCAVAFMLQVRLGGVFHNAMLVTLISFAFALGVAEIGFLAILAAWFLNWQPGLSPEIILLTVIPVALSACKDALPSSFLAGYFGATVLGVGAWYALSDASFITGTGAALVREIATGALWAFLCIVPVRIFARDAQ